MSLNLKPELYDERDGQRKIHCVRSKQTKYCCCNDVDDGNNYYKK